MEKSYVTLLMLVGVLSFTYITGALSSLISNKDNAQAELQQLKAKCVIR
jgi:hypothetical protein